VKRILLLSTFIAVFDLGCSREASTPPPSPHAQDLKITTGGFIQGGDEQQKIDGVCDTDDSRKVLHCDIYNGLSHWQVTELKIKLAWSPYSDDNVRDYREGVSIAPMTTASIQILLGTQLPPDSRINGKILKHYHWLIDGAKAVPAHSTLK
jgi:hypothetical protein